MRIEVKTNCTHVNSMEYNQEGNYISCTKCGKLWISSEEAMKKINDALEEAKDDLTREIGMYYELYGE